MKKHISKIKKGDRFRVFNDVHVASSDAALTATELGQEWAVKVDDGKGTVWSLTCENEEVEYIPLLEDEAEAKKVIEALKEFQKSEASLLLPCPRCGHMTMKHQSTRNALSRYADVYICSGCGMDEALRDFSGQPPLPFTQWGILSDGVQNLPLPAITFEEYVEQECARQWSELQESELGSWDSQPQNVCTEYYWSMYEHLWQDRNELDGVIVGDEKQVKVAIRVKGGLVQAVYSTGEDVDVEVYDLDVSSYPEEGEIDMVEERRQQLEKIEKSPAWHHVW